MAFAPDGTKPSHLPPFEVAKAYAFHEALDAISRLLDTPVFELLGERSSVFIAKHLAVKGGGAPTERAVRKAIKRCQDGSWWPGKPPANKGGRPCQIPMSQKLSLAEGSMGLKRALIRPTPGRLRAQRPRTSLNPHTDEPISNSTIYKIFTALCYDEREDDPWCFMHTLSQDYLPDGMKPRRVDMSQHIVDTVCTRSLQHHVAVDPCSSLLPKTLARDQEQKVASLGKMRFMSKKSRRKGINLRGPATAKKQKGGDVLPVHWTPIFAKGKVKIYVCNPKEQDPTLPRKLSDSEELHKFFVNVLPGQLDAMKQEHGWCSLPRTVVHDKASYFVNNKTERLNTVFATALQAARLRSWVGGAGDSAKWMAGRFGDVYPHETLIAHIRRLLDHKFCRAAPGESVGHFRARMAKVEEYLNSADFAAREGGGLESLSKSLVARCQACIDKKGERLHK